jgi:hypothetical protein
MYVLFNICFKSPHFQIIPEMNRTDYIVLIGLDDSSVPGKG